MTLEIIRLMSTHLLFDLQSFYDGCQLGQDLICLLVIFELGSDEVGEITKGFGRIEHLCWFSFRSCRAYDWRSSVYVRSS